MINKALIILDSLGGKENIETLDYCITRLRIKVKDRFELKTQEFKNLNAQGILDFGDGNIHFVFGTQSEILKMHLDELIKNEQYEFNKQTKEIAKSSNEIFYEDLKSPMKGMVIGLEQVDDPLFSKKLIGDGIAIIPYDGIVKSPINGIVENIFKTGHAIIIKSINNLEVLVHIGIDTVTLKGEGFKLLVKEGQRVNIGDKILEFDMDILKDNNKDLTSPIIILNLGDFNQIKLKKTNLKEVVYEDLLIEVGF